jgi:hypothetical protein
MWPAGAILRLFAQWLRPTTRLNTQPGSGWIFLPIPTCSLGFPRVLLDFVVFTGAQKAASFA